MSIYSLRGFSVRFCRQAHILANVGPGVASMPGRTNLRLSLWETVLGHRSHRSYIVDTRHANLFGVRPRLLADITRSSHNNLYQMVKKRTLEARTKLQHNKFPNQQPCNASNAPSTEQATCERTAATSKPNPESKPKCDIETKPKPRPSTPPCPKIQQDPCKDPSKKKRQEKINQRDIKTTTASKSSDCVQKPRTTDCGGSRGDGGDGVRKNVCSGRKVVGGGSGKSGKSDDSQCEEEKQKNKMLLAALAALTAATLFFWWLSSRRKDKSNEGVVPCEPSYSAPATVPTSSAELPKHVPYLLIGGGTAAFSAFRAIKSNDPRAKVLVISNEPRKPYMKPPLSKQLWDSAQPGETSKDYRFKKFSGAETSLFFEPDEFFVDPTKLMDTPNGGIAVAQGFSVRKIDPTKHIAVLGDGYEITYDECLIATGSSPRILPVFEQAPASVKEKIMTYRTPDDFDRLKRYADENKSITIVGNGFTGSELACSLANYTKDKKSSKIYQVFEESGNMSRVLPDYLSKWTTTKVQSLGVCVMPYTRVKGVNRDESHLKLVLDNGKTLLTDVVVVCVGTEPNTSIATTSGLEVDNSLGGFVVNAELEARANLFVAGDASCFYDPLLGRRRVEHHDHSVVSGKLAGENMVGKKKAFTHQSMFWSDLGTEIGYEGVGLVDSSLPTVGVFALQSNTDKKGRTDHLVEKPSDERNDVVTVNKDAPPVTCDPKDADDYGRGVIFYMKDEKIVGILLWNLFNRTGLARTIINQDKQYEDLNEVAKLFEIHA